MATLAEKLAVAGCPRTAVTAELAEAAWKTAVAWRARVAATAMVAAPAVKATLAVRPLDAVVLLEASPAANDAVAVSAAAASPMGPAMGLDPMGQPPIIGYSGTRVSVCSEQTSA